MSYYEGVLVDATIIALEANVGTLIEALAVEAVVVAENTLKHMSSDIYRYYSCGRIRRKHDENRILQVQSIGEPGQ